MRPYKDKKLSQLEIEFKNVIKNPEITDEERIKKLGQIADEYAAREEMPHIGVVVAAITSKDPEVFEPILNAFTLGLEVARWNVDLDAGENKMTPRVLGVPSFRQHAIGTKDLPTVEAVWNWHRDNEMPLQGNELEVAKTQLEIGSIRDERGLATLEKVTQYVQQDHETLIENLRSAVQGQDSEKIKEVANEVTEQGAAEKLIPASHILEAAIKSNNQDILTPVLEAFAVGLEAARKAGSVETLTLNGALQHAIETQDEGIFNTVCKWHEKNGLALSGGELAAAEHGGNSAIIGRISEYSAVSEGAVPMEAMDSTTSGRSSPPPHFEHEEPSSGGRTAPAAEGPSGPVRRGIPGSPPAEFGVFAAMERAPSPLVGAGSIAGKAAPAPAKGVV